jgi:hypothetical protein
MAYFLFIDESGQDHRDSPYEVLAGVAVEDRDLWNLVKAMQDSELRHFGVRYRTGDREIKAKTLLKRKTFKLASQLEAIPENQRRDLAQRCLENGEDAGKRELTALAQAKLFYIQDVLDICAGFRCKVFASIVNRDSPKPNPTYLRKDYSYLFERFFYFLEDKDTSLLGIIVFDELDRSRSHILIGQMDKYFKHTINGKQRAGQIIPEPFFVHSELTTGIQLADLVAYITSWGIRFETMQEPKRDELDNFSQQVCDLRYRAIRELNGNPNFVIWSFAIIPDLRGGDDRGEDI